MRAKGPGLYQSRWLGIIGLAIGLGAVAFFGLWPAVTQVEPTAMARSSQQTSASAAPETQVTKPETLPPSTTGQSSNRPPAAPQISSPSVHAVAQAAVKMGVLSCVSRINQVATYLTMNAQSGVFIFSQKNQPDQHVFSTSFEILGQDKSLAYATASFWPNQDAVYDTVQYVDKAPEEVAQTTFGNLSRIGMVKKNILLLDGGAVKVFLMPAGSGCIVIKKEVLK